MSHPCACCALRFATSAELVDHVRAEHVDHPPFAEGQATIVTPRRYHAPPRGKHVMEEKARS